MSRENHVTRQVARPCCAASVYVACCGITDDAERARLTRAGLGVGREAGGTDPEGEEEDAHVE